MDAVMLRRRCTQRYETNVSMQSSCSYRSNCSLVVAHSKSYIVLDCHWQWEWDRVCGGDTKGG